jgi:hypothetical protein
MSPSREVCCSPVRDRQIGFAPLAGLPAVDPRVVRSGPCVARLALEVLEAGPDCLPDHVVDLVDQGGPVTVTVAVVGLAGQPGVLAEGGVEDRDRLGQRDREVEEQRAEPGLAGGLDAQLASALGRGIRLAGQQAGKDVLGFPAGAGRLSEGCAVWGFALAEQQVIRAAFDELAVLEAESFRTRAPPTARRLSPALAGLDVIPGRVLGRARVYLLPDVIQVVALAQGRDGRHRLIPRQPVRSSPRSSGGAWV